MGKFSRLGNDLYQGRKSYDFVGHRALWYTISGTLVGLAILVDRGQGAELRHRVHRRHAVPGQRPLLERRDPGDRRRAQRGDRQLVGRRRGRPAGHDLGRATASPSRPRTSTRPATARSAAIIQDVTGATDEQISKTEVGAELGPRGRQAGADRRRHLPDARGALHLGLLPRVEDVGRRADRALPRHRPHDRCLRAVRLPGHAGGGDRSARDPRLLDVRHGRRLRQDPGEHPRADAPAGTATRRRPTWPSTRRWSARSTPRSWRSSRSARSSTSAPSSSAPAR